jgi:hypothetical protein
MTNWADISRQVRKRAGGRCEYCRMHESLQGATFHLEHICPRAAGGGFVLDNLALACPSCNLHKSDRLRLTDAETGIEVSLFDPRRDQWTEHFHFIEFHVAGLSPVGRAAIAAFDLNSERRIRIRQAESLFGLFPP